MDISNPYLAKYKAVIEGLYQQPEYPIIVATLTREYAWVIPTQEAIIAMGEYSPLIEIGAGLGYWASLLIDSGYKIYAYDIELDIAKNIFIIGNKHWANVQFGGIEKINEHPDCTLFICGPIMNNRMPLDCLKTYKGKYLITACEDSSSFPHAKIYSAFLKELKETFQEIKNIKLPNWPTRCFELKIHQRKEK
jgi:hypothetical protein